MPQIPTRNIKVNSEENIAGMRKACALAREVLDIVAAHVRPGVTTDYLDQICFAEAVKRDCYPSPLGYHGYPKSICTSVNEVICHGIPDQYVLQDGDIINLDVTLFHRGYHGDLNMTYPVGPKARENEQAMTLIKTARQCLDIAIALCGPGIPYGALGHVIEPVAEARGCSVVRNYTGHGIGKDMFHGPPTVFHHRTKKAYGVMKPGHIFTIEPMLNLGSDWRDVSWPDDWTVASKSGQWSAASEETLLITETGVEVLTAQGGAKSYDTTNRRQAWARAEQAKAEAAKKN